jgi:hypothetical protein
MTARELKATSADDARLPGFIDPPGPFSPLSEWLEYRADLNRLDWPGLGPYKAQADRHIARLRAEKKDKPARS